MVEILKKYYPGILAALLVAVLFIIRVISPGNFKPDAEKNSKPAFTGDNLIHLTELNAAQMDYSLILLDNAQTKPGEAVRSISLSPSDILRESSLKQINLLAGKKVLVAEELSIAVRSWNLLTQLGIKELYVLVNKPDNESFKYKFRPTRSEVDNRN